MVLVSNLNHKRHFDAYEVSSLSRDLDKADYPTLIEDLMYNEIYQLKPVTDTSQYSYAVSYYQAAMLYNAYNKNGDTAKAQETAALMKEYLSHIQDTTVLNALSELDASLAQ